MFLEGEGTLKRKVIVFGEGTDGVAVVVLMRII
jgi:hypothetical protein